MTRPKLLNGDVRQTLRELESKSVQCVVTSPPYWSLRDYGNTPSIWGGDLDCDHKFGKEKKGDTRDHNVGKTRWNHVYGDGEISPHIEVSQGCYCKKCGAWKGCLGLEPTPQQFTKNMVEVFREVKRVLRDDGTLWLNIGDSYASSGGRQLEGGLKYKDLVGIPWQLAFALQEDGWYLRSDIIWHKPNPMPESVKDRPTKSHEYIFLFSKCEKYYYDYEAIKEKGEYPAGTKGAKGSTERYNTNLVNSRPPEYKIYDGMRNKRTVWSINTKPYKEAHFATFPEEIPEICIKAGTKTGDLVLDPFIGSGTTCAVAMRLGRKSIGIDLNEEYLKLARKRLRLESESIFKYV
tara:strand:- start:23 stop:1069 length:1047 start_codon:yes stop_codon:yes gene_type:complete